MVGESDCWEKEDFYKILNYTEKRLWRFVSENAALADKEEDIIENLLKLSSKDLEKLKKLHFILDDKIRNFIEVSASKIARRLSKKVNRPKKPVKALGRGKLDVLATVKEDFIKGRSESQFIIRENQELFDLPENRLFKFILRQISRIAFDFADKDLIYEEISSRNNNKWLEIIEEYGVKAYKLSRNAHLRNVEEINAINQSLIRSAVTSRDHWYEDLAEVAEVYYSVFEKEDEFKFLQEVIRERYLKPLDNNALYELFILFKLLDIIEKSDWKMVKTKLIGSNKGPVNIYTKDSKKLEIFYQRTPKLLKEESLYEDYLKNYDLECRARRPDIILKMDNNYCIVEVKRSDSRSYIVNGLYKLLGYLKDFEKNVNEGIGGVKGILAGWEIPQKIKSDSSGEDGAEKELILSDHERIESTFSRIIE